MLRLLSLPWPHHLWLVGGNREKKETFKEKGGGKEEEEERKEKGEGGGEGEGEGEGWRHR